MKMFNDHTLASLLKAVPEPCGLLTDFLSCDSYQRTDIVTIGVG